MTEPKTTGRRLFRYALIGVAALLVLILLLLVFVTLPPGENIVRGILEDQLTAALNQPVIIGDFETNLLSRIRIDSLRIPPRQPDTGLGLFINQLELRYSLWPLLSKTIDLNSVYIDSARLGIVRDSAQGYNLALLDSLVAPAADTTADTGTTAGTTASEESGSDWTFQLGPTHIEYLDARYVDYIIPLQAHLAGVSLIADQSDTLGLAFALDSDTGSIQYADYEQLPLVLFGRGAWMENATVIDTLRVTLGDMVLATEGMLSTVDPQPVDLTARLTGEPGPLLTIAREQYEIPEIRLEGPISIQANITGTLPLPRGRVRIELPTVQAMDMTLQEGLIVVEKAADTLTIDTLHAEIFGGAIDLGGRVLLDTVLNGLVDISLQSVDLADIWQTAYDTASPYRGELFGDIRVDLNGSDFKAWNITSNLRAENARYRNTNLENLAVTLALENRQLTADIRQDYFNIQAQVSLADTALQGQLTADIDRLGPLAGLLNLGDISGALTAEADLSGTMKNPTVQARLRGNNLRYQGFPIDSLQAQLRYADAQLYIEQLTATGSAAAYRAIQQIREELGLLPGNYTLMLGAMQAQDTEPLPSDTIETAIPDPLFGIESLFGGIEYTLNLSGPLDSLQGNLHADLTGVEYGGYTVDSGDVRVNIEGNRLVFDTLRIFRNSLLVQMRGYYNTETGLGEAVTTAYALGGEPPDTTQPLPADSITLPVPPEEYRPIGHLTSDFTYSTAGSFAVTAVGQRFELAPLSTFAPDTISLGGIADFTVAADGPLDSLIADIELAINEPRYQEVTLDSVYLAGSFDQGDLQIRNLGAWRLDQFLSGRLSTQLSLDTAGAWSVTEQTPVSGAIQMEKFHLGVIEPFLPEGSFVEGLMWLDMQFNGTVSDPNITGQLDIDSAQYAWGPDADTIRKINLYGTILDSTLTLDTATAMINEIPLGMEGTITLASDSRIRTDIIIRVDTLHTITAEGTLGADNLDFTARIDSLNLRILEPFVPMIDSLNGFLSATIDLQGSPNEPQMDGRLTAVDVTVKPEMLDRPLTSGRLEGRFTADNLVIDTLTARLGPGQIAASGTLEFDTTGLASIDMVLSGDTLVFTALEHTDVVIQDMNLTYQPDGEYYELAGTVDLGRVEYAQNFQLTELLPFTQEVQQVETELPPLFARTRLNVRLVNSDRIWIDNNLAKLRLDADLQFIGFMPDPNLSGRVLVEEGYILYLDRKFDVTEGVAYFTDPNEVNPEINLRAETEITTYRQTESITYEIALIVTGRLQSPQVELNSDPPLGRPDIISLLTVGATREQITGRTLGERAEVLAGQQVAGFAAGRLGEALGLDRVTVTGNIFNVGDTTGPRLTVAKELSEDVTLTYRTTVGHLNDQEISVNWELSRHWLLEGTTTRNGESALNLTYALRFR